MVLKARIHICGREDGVLGQLGRAVKAIDSKSIGVTRVSSSLTAVGLFGSAPPSDVSRSGGLV